MKIAFVADPHIANHQAHGGAPIAGINRRCQLALDTLQLAVHKANELDCTEFVVLGDLYDTTRPLPQIETAVRRVLTSFNRTVHLLLGNHDRNSGLLGDHALGPLNNGSIIVEDQPRVFQELGLLPFRPEPVTSWLKEEVKKLADQGAKVLGVHFGLHDADMRKGAFWMEGCADAAPVEWVGEVLREHGIFRLFAGNWHSYRSWWKEYQSAQVGALVPTGWDNAGFYGYGSLLTYDSAMPISGAFSMERLEIPGPRFVKRKFGEDLPYQNLTQRDYPLFVRMIAKPSDFAAAVAVCKEAYWLAGYEVVADDESTREAAQVSAQAARRLDTLGEIAIEYVAGLELPTGARPEEVTRLVRSYLGV